MQRRHYDEEKAKKAELKMKKTEESSNSPKLPKRKRLVESIKTIVPGFKSEGTKEVAESTGPDVPVTK